MQIGLGLPAAVPEIPAGHLLEWAVRVESRGFASIATLDRLVYGNYEPLVTLAAVAAVTHRIRLASYVLLLPLHASAALLATQVATLDRLSGGRFALGMGVGAREDDYRAAGVPFAGRGRRFEALLEEMCDIWSGAGAPIGPAPVKDRPEIIIGGRSERAFGRAARFGDGWVAGSADVAAFRQGRDAMRSAWDRHGRAGAPRTRAVSYFALGPDAKRHASEHLGDYYAFTGVPPDALAGHALTDGPSIRSTVDALAAAGCDELVLFPCDPDPGQVDLLADALPAEHFR